MLNYLYNGTVVNLNEKARDLLPVAQKYDLPGLRTECSLALVKQINLETAVELALLADLYSVEHLKQAAVGFIVGNKKYYQEESSWCETFASNPSLLVDIFKKC